MFLGAKCIRITVISSTDTFMKTNNVTEGGIFKIATTHPFNTLQNVTETAKTVTTVSDASTEITGLTNHGFVTGDAVTYTSMFHLRILHV